MLAAGDFRQDLYYRISAFPIPIPPLRERGSDLTLLIDTLLQRIAPPRRLSLDAAALACLQRYPFPGNVRELRNILERASLLTDANTILPEHLPEECRPERSGSCPDPSHPPEIVTLAEAQRRYLREVLSRHPGDHRSLARELGISARTLYRKAKGL
jgi:transcriptional regulator with PAS, ATPase and Fis domain